MFDFKGYSNFIIKESYKQISYHKKSDIKKFALSVLKWIFVDNIIAIIALIIAILK